MTLPSMMVVGAVVVYALGVLTGHGLNTAEQSARQRRQAATQHSLNDQFRILREKQEATEEELRWRYKQQAGMTTFEYDVTDTKCRFCGQRRNGWFKRRH